MRPTPSEIIAGVRSILADTIGPELADDHARSRLAEIRAVLAQVDWDDAGFALKARATALALRLTEAGQWAPDALPAAPEVESFAAYQQYWEALCDKAVQVLERIAEYLVEHPRDSVASATNQSLLSAL